MEFINWSGAIFGPGSEWFWAMAQFVVVVITVMAVYRQLRAQGAANAVGRVDTLSGRWSSDLLAYTRLALALELRYEPTSERTMARARPVLNFFADLDDLHSAGYLSLKEIALAWGNDIQRWYPALTPVLERERAIHGEPDAYKFDELVAELRRFDLKRGVVHDQGSEAEIRRWLDFVIANGTEWLRLEQEWKSGVIPVPPPTVRVGLADVGDLIEP